MNELFIIGKTILEQLKENDFQAYFVGGCVRDHQMQRPISDVDITTDALPEDVESIFRQTIDVGKEHGTIIVLHEGVPFEVTTFRTESTYSDHRRPDAVSFTTSLTGDLERRDFTINAMAMDEDFELIDPFSGMEDIYRRLIRTVGMPDERFDEDALRILRAVRFMAQLDFVIDKETRSAMAHHAAHLKFVAVERSLVELKKIYAGSRLSDVKAVMIKTGIKNNLPFLKEVPDEDFISAQAVSVEGEAALQIHKAPHLINHLPALKLSNREKARVRQMTALLSDLGKDAGFKDVSYAFPPDILEEVKELVHINEFPDKESLICILEKAVEVKPHLPIARISDIEIDGHTLMEYFAQKGGRWIKEVFAILEYEILHGRLENDKDKILKWMDEHVELEAGNIRVIGS